MIVELIAGAVSIATVVLTGWFSLQNKKLELQVKRQEGELKVLNDKDKVHPAANPYVTAKHLQNHHFFHSITRILDSKVDTVQFTHKLSDSEPPEINHIRKEYFVQIMRIKWYLVAGRMRDFVSGEDFNEMDKLEFSGVVNKWLADNGARYQKALVNSDLNPEIIQLYFAFQQPYREFALSAIERILDSDSIYVNNNAKMYAVMDWTDITLVNDMTEIERFFKSLNGHFAKILNNKNE
jgi:hypothetical protein